MEVTVAGQSSNTVVFEYWTPASTKDYALLLPTFDINLASSSCQSYDGGGWELATWVTSQDLQNLITLCGTQTSPCYTQYKVDAGQHISVIDAHLMPSYFTFWEGTPLYTIGQNVMARWDEDFLHEQAAAGPMVYDSGAPAI